MVFFIRRCICRYIQARPLSTTSFPVVYVPGVWEFLVGISDRSSDILIEVFEFSPQFCQKIRKFVGGGRGRYSDEAMGWTVPYSNPGRSKKCFIFQNVQTGCLA